MIQNTDKHFNNQEVIEITALQLCLEKRRNKPKLNEVERQVCNDDASKLLFEWE